MQNAIVDNILLIIFLPLWIFLIVMCGRFLSVYVNKFLMYLLTLLSSFLGIIITLTSLIKINEVIEWSVPIIQIKNFIIPLGIHIDKLALIIAVVLYTISFLVQIFSVAYMKNEKKNYRFFALLNLFNFVMSALLFSPNLFQMYVFWELVGIVSYLLIGFDYTKKEKSEASKKVFLVNRIGDTALLGGIILSSYYMYGYVADKSLSSLSFINFNEISMLLAVYTSTPEFLTISLLFVIAAIVKSAQFPFYTWLQDAMEAHIPVSALLHSATMVIAGVYLVIRMFPIFIMNSYVLKFILLTGLFTAFICSILASVETHYKKVLAYSTSANLGLMFVALGLENIKACILFLIAHAFIKAMLFLDLPDRENKISYAGILLFALGGLSLAGILFAGFCTKEYLFINISNNYISYVFVFISFLTSFYISRLTLSVLKNSVLVKKINMVEFLPILFLLILNIIFYFMLNKYISTCISAPYYAGILGILLAFVLFKLNLINKFNTTPKLTENFYNNIVAKTYEKIALGLNYAEHKFILNYKPLFIISRCAINTINWIEMNIINKGVTLVSDSLKGLSKMDSVMQTKNVQTYNSYAFIMITCIITLLIVAYKLILDYMS